MIFEAKHRQKNVRRRLRSKQIDIGPGQIGIAFACVFAFLADSVGSLLFSSKMRNSSLNSAFIKKGYVSRVCTVAVWTRGFILTGREPIAAGWFLSRVDTNRTLAHDTLESRFATGTGVDTAYLSHVQLFQ